MDICKPVPDNKHHKLVVKNDVINLTSQCAFKQLVVHFFINK